MIKRFFEILVFIFTPTKWVTVAEFDSIAYRGMYNIKTNAKLYIKISTNHKFQVCKCVLTDGQRYETYTPKFIAIQMPETTQVFKKYNINYQ